MEGFPTNSLEAKAKPISIEESIDRIKNACVQAAELYFEENDPLREKIIEYYKNRPETNIELGTILGKINEQELQSRVKSYEAYANDRTAFIEEMERFFDRVDMHKREKEIIVSPEVATDEEYELGTYFDSLEPQVQDAVRAIQKKGYETFQSGFSEKNKRDQFFDFYDRNIHIPERFVEKCREKGIEVTIEQFDDRTTVTFHPFNANAVRLSEWKETLDSFAESLPESDKQMAPNMKRYNNYHNFRTEQDNIKRSRETKI